MLILLVHPTLEISLSLHFEEHTATHRPGNLFPEGEYSVNTKDSLERVRRHLKKDLTDNLQNKEDRRQIQKKQIEDYYRRERQTFLQRIKGYWKQLTEPLRRTVRFDKDPRLLNYREQNASALQHSTQQKNYRKNANISGDKSLFRKEENLQKTIKRPFGEASTLQNQKKHQNQIQEILEHLEQGQLYTPREAPPSYRLRQQEQLKKSLFLTENGLTTAWHL